MTSGDRVGEQLTALGPEPSAPAARRMWERSVVIIIFGTAERGCDCDPTFNCKHEPLLDTGEPNLIYQMKAGR